MAIVTAGSRLLEVGELEARLVALEATVGHDRRAGSNHERPRVDGSATLMADTGP